MLRFWDYSIRQGLTHNSANFVKGPGRDIPENAEQPHDWGFANLTEEKEDGHGENPCADRDYDYDEHTCMARGWCIPSVVEDGTVSQMPSPPVAEIG